MSLRLTLARALARAIVKPMLRRAGTPEQARADFERGARFLPPPPFLLSLPAGAGGDRITAGPVSERACILWFHGGAYLTGSPRSHSAMLGRLSRLTGLAVIAPAYPLAPEHPAPAAFDHACAAHAALIGQGWRPEQILLGGDSAGGGLALALLAHLCAQGQPPGAAIVFSPWTDLTLSGASLTGLATTDPVIPVSRMAEAVAMVRGHLAADDPRLSPLFADFPSAPPVLIQIGGREVLRDDSLRMAERLHSFGCDVTVQEWPAAPHVWQMLDGLVPEAREALRMAADFIRAR